MLAWDIPMYTVATVGRFVKLHPDRVRRWLHGYDYFYSAGADGETRYGHKEPVVIRGQAAASQYVPFLDLIDLLFVKKFLEHGISLQRVRKALHEAEELIGGHHFAQNKFFTDGKKIYLEIKGKEQHADALLELLSGGQWVIAQVIKQLAQQIEFDRPTGFARRWYPLGPNGLVVLDPSISFGRPTIRERGVPTANVYDLYLGERENIESVCSWMNLDKKEVKAAVDFEIQLAA
jgi:uncharacterized protein (DUF433 family)